LDGGDERRSRDRRRRPRAGPSPPRRLRERPRLPPPRHGRVGPRPRRDRLAEGLDGSPRPRDGGGRAPRLGGAGPGEDGALLPRFRPGPRFRLEGADPLDAGPLPPVRPRRRPRTHRAGGAGGDLRAPTPARLPDPGGGEGPRAPPPRRGSPRL